MYILPEESRKHRFLLDTWLFPLYSKFGILKIVKTFKYQKFGMFIYLLVLKRNL